MITLSLFGVADLRNDAGGRAHSVLAQAKHVALLACLAQNRHSLVPRERVIAMLWPDLDDTHARNALSKAIHGCRRTLGEHALVGRFVEEIGLDAPQWSCDVWAFDDAIKRGEPAQALDHYRRGDFLDGLHVPDADGLEQWIDGERSRLRRRAMDATLALADAAERRGDLAESLSQLRYAGTLNPFDEGIARRHMELLDRTGDRAGALERYREHAARLSRELDTQPSPETQAHVDAIRRRSEVNLTEIVPTAPTTAATVLAAHHNGHAANRQLIEGTEPTPARNPDAEPNAADVRPNAPNARFGRRISLLVAAAVVVLVASLALMRRASTTNVDTLPSRTLVVPFEDRSNDSTLVAVGEMTADLLSAALSRAGVADVVDSRTRIRQGFSVADREQGVDSERLAEIALKAGISTIVTGSYYLTNGALTITAQVRGLNGATVAQRFAEETGPKADPREVIRKVEQRLLGVFASLRDRRLVAASTATSAAPTLAAYSEYVAGLASWTHGELRTAATHFERAYQLDSTFVGVLPLLTESLSLTGRGARADSIVANLGPRRALLGAYDQALLDWRVAWNAGKRETLYEVAQRMVRIAPRSSDAQWTLGFSATTTNRFAVAIAAFNKADLYEGYLREGVLSALKWQVTAYHLLGRYDDELAVVRRFQVRHPEMTESCDYLLRPLAMTLTVTDLEPQLTACGNARAAKDSAMPSVLRLHVASELHAHGRPDDARRVLQPAITWLREQGARNPESPKWRDMLGTALMTIEAWAEAKTLLLPQARALANNMPPRFAANAGIAAHHAGDTAVANEMLARLRAESPASAFVFLQRARLLAHMGRREDAVVELRQAVEKGLSAAELFHANLGFEPLRGYSPFDALVAPRQ